MFKKWLDKKRGIWEWENWDKNLLRDKVQMNHELLDILKQKKTSDTLFIMGSGLSINLLSEKELALIFSKDTFSLNQFVAYPKETTFHHFECYPEKIELHLKWLKGLEKRSTTWIFNGNLLTNSERNKIKEFYKDVKFTFARECWGKIDSNYGLFQGMNLRINKSILSYIHFRGSITIPITLAANLGYENIVLVGVDLNNYQYFYENSEVYPGALAVSIREELESRKKLRNYNGIHATNDPTLYVQNATITEIIKALNQYLDLNIYCWNDKSILIKHLQSYSDLIKADI